MIRLGMTLGIKEEKIEEYKKLHANVWPEVLENLTELNFKNFSISLLEKIFFKTLGFPSLFCIFSIFLCIIIHPY